MKYTIAISVLLTLLLGSAFTVSGAATTTTVKTTVSGEVKAKAPSKIKVTLKKKKLLEKSALTKKLEELQSKIVLSAANLEVMKVKLQAVSTIDPKQYALHSRLLNAARIKHQALQKEIDAINAQIKKINTWLIANS